MTYLEKLLRANMEQEKVSETSLAERSKLYVELSAIPDDLGGGFYVTMPPLGRWFAHTDGETIEEAFAKLNEFLLEIIDDDEYRNEFKEVGIIIP
jgi:predicted RNase H-like HicB family nuclease